MSESDTEANEIEEVSPVEIIDIDPQSDDEEIEGDTHDALISGPDHY